MLLPAFSVALIGLIQGAGVSQGYPNPDGKYPNVSRDFLGQGVANMATSLVGGLPAGGSISGTALIISAGARSRWTNIFAGLFVAVIVLVAAPLVELVPMPALAALLIVAGFQGLRVQQAITVWNTGKVAGVVMVMTFAATLLVPLQYAVLLGVALSILLFVFRQSNKVVVTEIVPVPGGLPEERPAPKQLPSNQLTMLLVYGSLFFAAAKNLEDLLPEVDETTHAVVAIGLRGKTEIGSTFISVLQRYAESLHAHDSKLMLVGVDPAVRDQLAKTGLLKPDRRGERLPGHAAAGRRDEPGRGRGLRLVGPEAGGEGMTAGMIALHTELWSLPAKPHLSKVGSCPTRNAAAASAGVPALHTNCSYPRPAPPFQGGTPLPTVELARRSPAFPRWGPAGNRSWVAASC